mmetsp:Transcript_10972/g.16966  ORF Transcript_10972/g.16966 Transcript_10972/m.16966 type:complete len:468 (+) Transcript_10972:25-1428(+)
MAEAETTGLPGGGESRAGSLFKKKKIGFKKMKAARGRIRNRNGTQGDSDEDNQQAVEKSQEAREEEEGVSAMEAIASAKKKRKLLNSALGKDRRGLDASLLLKPKKSQTTGLSTTAEDAISSTNTASTNQDVKERLRGTFSEGIGGDAVGGTGDGVIEQKHKAAKEEFIRRNLESKLDGGGENSQQSDANGTAPKSSNNPSDMEAQLYQELASTAVQLSGTKLPGSGDDGAKEQEGDVGAGGAMLAGTGIAEVALPAEERLQTAIKTEQAAKAKGRMRYRQGSQQQARNTHQFPSKNRIEDQILPTSFSAGIGKRSNRKQPPLSVQQRIGQIGVATATDKTTRLSGPTMSSAGAEVLQSDIEGVGSSYSHNFRMHTAEWVSKKKEEQEAEQELARQQQQKDEGPAESKERLGFEAARRAVRGESFQSASRANDSRGQNDRSRKSGANQQRSSDDRVWKSFVQRERKR